MTQSSDGEAPVGPLAVLQRIRQAPSRTPEAERCEMCAEPSAIHDAAQVRNRNFTQRHALHRLAAQTQHTDAECMVSRFFITTDVASTDQGPKQVAG